MAPRDKKPPNNTGAQFEDDIDELFLPESSEEEEEEQKDNDE